jgi:Na+/melibiose symporter-like transporter
MHARRGDTAVRRWSNVWIAAVTTFGVAGLLQWVVLPPGGTLAEIAKGVEIAAIVVAICGLFRWAALRERERRKSRSKDVSERKP